MKKLSEFNFDQLQIGDVCFNPQTGNTMKIVHKDIDDDFSIHVEHHKTKFLGAWYHFGSNIPEHLYVLEEGEIV